jgi:2-keto-3-deoxy-L-rhamnonate aldolase RhmA
MYFIFITNVPELAMHAEAAGVDRIMIDLEAIGKCERQGHLDTLISQHTLEDIGNIKVCLSRAEVLARVNPIHPGSELEISRAIQLGADRLMLPMFKTRAEVEKFIKFTGGRAKTCLLLETAQALVRIDEILEVPGIDEVHIGINDLHLAMGLTFMFELLSGGIVEYVCSKIKAKGIPFGFGGIARLGTGTLDAALILSEHVRIGSQAAILARTFHSQSRTVAELTAQIDLKHELARVRAHVERLVAAPLGELQQNRDLVSTQVRALVRAKGFR